MLTKYNISLLIYLICLLSKTESVIKNCLFINTVNLTDLKPNINNTYFFNNIEIPSHLVDDYNYEILENGTRINIENHKRGCICPDPCLSVCSNFSLELYNLYKFDEEINSIFFANVSLENDTSVKKDLFVDFNHRVGEMCNVTYHLNAVDSERDKWILFMNGTLLLQYPNLYKNQGEYCFEMIDIDGSNNYLFTPRMCYQQRNIPNELKLKGWAMLCSTPFFIFTIFIYCVLPQFRSCHGKCFVMYLSYLALSYGLTCFVILSGMHFPKIECFFIGYSIYFTTISFLMWTCILSYDTWKTLTHIVVRSSFGRYLFWGCMIPLLALLLTFVAQIIPIDDKLKPGIEETRCGINTYRWSATIYYYIPHIIVLLFSLTMYIRVLCYIAKNDSKVTGIAGNIENLHKERFFMNFRLFTYMGVTWTLDIVSYFLYVTSEKSLHITDIFTALNGLFVFITFMCNPSIYRKVKKRLSKSQTSNHGRIVRSFSEDIELENIIKLN